MDGTKAVCILTELTTPKVILEYDLNGDPIIEYGYSFDEYQKAVETLSGIVSKNKEMPKRILLKLNEAGGCDAADEWGQGWDEAISEAIRIVEDETGIHIEDVLDEEFVEEQDVRTNFDVCCESIDALAQIIDIAKIGWTKEQIKEWLKKPVSEQKKDR